MHATSLRSPAAPRLLFLAVALIAMALGGCASRPTASFANGKPEFDPGKFFLGRTHSWGIVDSPGGWPKEIITTRTEGHWEADAFHFEQDIAFEKREGQHRSWLIRRVDAHHFTATGTGIVGEARGEAYGNVFHLEFTMALGSGNPLLHVHMSQWMFLQPDGRTMINSDTITKAGVIVARITEQFVKEGR